MNIFYAPPEQISSEAIELTGQEAIHASKALRYRQGDSITVVDGRGGWYEGEVVFITDDRVQVSIESKTFHKALVPSLTLALGIIKKRDRLEFAVEKAVELGVKEIILFRGDHSVKQNIREDRLQSVILSAMKQSLQAWQPELHSFASLDDLLSARDEVQCVTAYQEGEPISDSSFKSSEDYILIVGPEGGFSEKEMETLRIRDSRFVKIHPNRLRAETAVVTFLSIMRNQ